MEKREEEEEEGRKEDKKEIPIQAFRKTSRKDFWDGTRGHKRT